MLKAEREKEEERMPPPLVPDGHGSFILQHHERDQTPRKMIIWPTRYVDVLRRVSTAGYEGVDRKFNC